METEIFITLNVKHNNKDINICTPIFVFDANLTYLAIKDQIKKMADDIIREVNRHSSIEELVRHNTY